MEKVTMTKNSPKYGFKKDDEFVVKKNIRNECVIIIDDENIPNLILSIDGIAELRKTIKKAKERYKNELNTTQKGN
mgnify:CR=1 FL=1